MEDNQLSDQEASSHCVNQLQCSRLIVNVAEHQLPIVYSHEYNISFGLIDKLQSYDICKWGRMFSLLKEAGLVNDETVVHPNEAQMEDLLIIHSKTYLDNLKLSHFMEGVTELSSKMLGIDLSSFIMLPEFLVLSKILRSFRFQTGGTVLATQLALERGWSINIGGGFHHCCTTRGGGFCPYADMTLAVRFLFESVKTVKKVMIVDLSAHQGNGLGRDFLDDGRVYILDVYNRDVYPHDGFAKRGISCKVELRSKVDDEEYLRQVRRGLDRALGDFEPDLVMYNAGSDVLLGDHTGGMFISSEGIIERDQIVFVKVRSRGIPIVMLMGGGYHRMSACVMTDSILNLHRMGLITGLSPDGKISTGQTANESQNTPPKRFSTMPDLLADHQKEEKEESHDLLKWFRTVSSRSTVRQSASNDLKERQTSLGLESSFLRGIRRSLSSSTVDRILS